MAATEQPEPPPPAAAGRFTVGLTYRAMDALENLERRTGLKRVELVNRALQVYDTLDTDIAQGAKVLLLQPDGTMQRIIIT